MKTFNALFLVSASITEAYSGAYKIHILELSCDNSY